jgi:two-component system, OmpR family, alkaline phosphatase synthesis response regulator PhoP
MAGLKSLTKKIEAVLKNQYVIRKSIRDLKVGKLVLHSWNNTITVDGKDIVLAKPEFDILFFFSQNPMRSVSPELIRQCIWDSDYHIGEAGVEGYIENLAHKFGRNVIEKKFSNFYRFVPSALAGFTISSLSNESFE